MKQSLEGPRSRPSPERDRKAREEHTDDLEVDEDPDFESVMWRIRRVVWLLVPVGLAAGLAGAFGSGALSRAELRDRSGRPSLEYERILHFRTPSQLVLHAGQGTGADGQVRVSIAKSWIDAVELEGVVPEPEAAQSRSSDVRYTFAAVPPASFRLQFTPARIGLVRGEVAVDGTDPVVFQQLVLP